MIDSVRSLAPIILVIAFFQLLVLRQPLLDLGALLAGTFLVVLGLTLFLRGLEMGLFPLGESLAHGFARKGSLAWLLIFGFALGFGTTVAEPALIAVAGEAAVAAAKGYVIADTQAARVACYPLGVPTDLFASPQLAAREFFQDAPGLPGLRVPGRPYRIETSEGADRVRPTRPPIPGAGPPQPLAGVRIVDFSWVLTGPICTKFLAALGAEVIKIESRARPDLSQRDPSWEELNPSKKSITLNLTEEPARDLARRLIAMYGKTGVDFPRRIVCLTAETTEIAFALGAGDRVVGVPGTARRPEAARARARVGGFTSFRADKILALGPDLVLAFSDLQRDVVGELIAAGVSVLCTNQRSFDEVLGAILVVGGALGREAAARELVADMRDEVTQIREYSSAWPDRPRVYFEEWMDPLISGIGWVSDLIELGGGRDVFAELREHRGARERIVDADEVVRRDPQIILASWCGKPVDRAAIAARPGWSAVAAVAAAQIHEIPGEDVLAPGPSLMHGLRRIHEIIHAFQGS